MSANEQIDKIQAIRNLLDRGVPPHQAKEMVLRPPLVFSPARTRTTLRFPRGGDGKRAGGKDDED